MTEEIDWRVKFSEANTRLEKQLIEAATIRFCKS